MSVTAIILLVLKASIFLSVFAIGLKATVSEAGYMVNRPGQLLRAMLSMNVLMPVLAVVIGLMFDFHPAVKIALVAISVSPIPPIFPNKAFKAGGTENYTIGLMVASCALAVIVIPVAMEIVERVTGIPLTVRARTVAATVVMTVFFPLLLGIGFKWLAPSLAERLAKPMAVIALGLLILSALPVLVGMSRPMFSLLGDGTLVAISVFAFMGFIVGHLLGGPDPANRATLALASASRHPAVALGIAHANFPDQREVAPAVFLYLIVSGVLSVVYLAWAKRHEVTAATTETNHAVKA